MELLSPVGRIESLKPAVLYGADAVYLGGEMYGLRANAQNFDLPHMEEAVLFAHRHGVKVYVTVNIIAHNDHLTGISEYVKNLEKIGVDALIVADAGVISLIQEAVPHMELHLSTQASATNYATFNFWHRQGIKRIVAARELSLEELKAIREKTDPGLEIEAFVHGAMCISISGRCLVSNYLTGRDSNLGECTHPCRWTYRLVEESRPLETFPIMEEDGYTYLFNSRDLCMIEYLPELAKTGIHSIKIEGRMKSPLYVALVTKAYREALDDLEKDPALYESKKAYYKELLSMADQRGFTTGFYFGKPDRDDQLYETSVLEREAVFAGIVIGHDEVRGTLVEQRGKFSVGDDLTLIPEKNAPVTFTVDTIDDETQGPVTSAPHAKQHVYLHLPVSCSIGCVLVKWREKK